MSNPTIISEAAWTILDDFSNDAEEIMNAYHRGMDCLIDPKIGLVMTSCVTSLTREISEDRGWIVLHADTGKVTFN